ncbi:CTAG/PCC1 family protein [Candidatus Woesearchaeota archaeon]|nr:CTAG/PCC1 family protein [Candidatus Woesearchaeota archaeon]
MLNAIITVPQNKELLKAFSLEEKIFPNGRAKYEIKQEKNKLKFNIQAKDSTALRSIINTITKLITIQEKTDQLIKND